MSAPVAPIFHFIAAAGRAAVREPERRDEIKALLAHVLVHGEPSERVRVATLRAFDEVLDATLAHLARAA